MEKKPAGRPTRRPPRKWRKKNLKKNLGLAKSINKTLERSGDTPIKVQGASANSVQSTKKGHKQDHTHTTHETQSDHSELDDDARTSTSFVLTILDVSTTSSKAITRAGLANCYFWDFCCHRHVINDARRMNNILPTNVTLRTGEYVSRCNLVCDSYVKFPTRNGKKAIR